MADERPFDVSGPTLKEIAQQLLTAKTQARSIQNVSDALMPLASDSANKILVLADDAAKEAEKHLTTLYRVIAKEAMQS